MPIDTTPSTTATAALQGIPFSALIGGPLGAAVNAQVQSAKATIDFIQNVGLTGPPEDRKAIQIEFVYYVDGREAKLLVPLLTILPIPYLAVNEVDISFKASINASSSTYQEDSTQTQTDAKGGADIKFGWGPVSGNAHFEASYSSKKDSKATSESKYSVEYTMDVHVHAGQEDMPAGLARVLNILTDSITPTAKQANIQVSPATLTAADPTKGEQTLLVTATLYDEKGLRAAGKDITLNFAPNFDNSKLNPQLTTLPLPGKTDENGTAEIEITIPAVPVPAQAEATAAVDTSGKLTAITLVKGKEGKGYSSANPPKVTIAPPPPPAAAAGTSGTQAEATAAVDASGKLTITLTSGKEGSGYDASKPPKVTIDPPPPTPPPAQRVKLQLSSTDPAASKTITLLIPEFIA